MDLGLNDKVALVTGAGSQIGFGKGIVMALARNKRVKNNQILGTDFYNDWVLIKTAENYKDNAFLSLLPPHQPIHMPIAHGEGRFILAKGLYERLQRKNVGMMQYCDAEGEVYENFPTNPNGSEYNLY